MAEKVIDVVTIGESMVLFQPTEGAQIPFSPYFVPSVGGAESNVVTALSRLGLSTKWISHLGSDPFSKLILSALAGEGVDVEDVKQIDGEKTAVFFKEKSVQGDPKVYYYRNGSAASKLSVNDIQDSWFEGARHLHVTGITLAIGKSTPNLVKATMEKAKERGMTVSFDPNIRLKLQSVSFWKKSIMELLPLVDIFMPGKEEAELLLGSHQEEETLAQFLSKGPKVVVMKLGEEGSITGFNDTFHREPPRRISHIVDTVGAGDAFSAGFLSVLLQEREPLNSSILKNLIPTAATRANAMGALATQYKGDWEGNPSVSELTHFMEGTQGTTR
ncbi:sugar kinase [Paenalkalicoccus suaedae]|uniref:Sugar kinase n=1 Tax=Paenalkalicoccus suaedae TaxID=2592382 RepID=A0A859FA14_9BACI|nr:sugar kinase [Paenalkalicoccus suaedae]QKS69727.1 sugar kinase [Paenalkalicoccus suaedae]